MEEEKVLENVRKQGALLRAGLEKIAADYSWIKGVRGLGLLNGLVLDQPAKELEKLLTAKGLLTIATADKVIRFLPPLTVCETAVNKALGIVAAACAEFKPVAG
jgi:acetylornithine/succinyldiaminopimelate/putrescine aminotransferase